jgi:hypothetical protein
MPLPLSFTQPYSPTELGGKYCPPSQESFTLLGEKSFEMSNVMGSFAFAGVGSINAAQKAAVLASKRVGKTLIRLPFLVSQIGKCPIREHSDVSIEDEACARIGAFRGEYVPFAGRTG